MLDSTISLVTVTALLLGSPGPAPLALAGTSAVFGVKQGVPFLLGVLAGLTVAIIAAVFGLAALFSVYPSTKLFLQILGALYIVFVAYKIASAPTTMSGDAHAKNAPTFVDGFILNLLNPKAYAAFLAIFSQFLLPLENVFASYLFTSAVCLLVATAVDILWLCSGSLLRPLFHRPRIARFLRALFAALMVIAVIWTLAK